MICHMIQRLNSNNLLTDKVAEKVHWTIYRLDKKAKKVPESWKWIFHKVQCLKLSNIFLSSVSEHVRKKLCNLLAQLIQFTDQQIYLKKHQTVEKNLTMYVSTKYFPI